MNENIRSVLAELLAKANFPPCSWWRLTGIGPSCGAIATRVHSDGLLPWELCDQHAREMGCTKDLPHADVVRRTMAMLGDGGW